MEIANLISAVILVLAGAIIHYGKSYDLIAGYNTRSKEQQQATDIEGIARLMFRCFVVMAIILVVGALPGFWMESNWFVIATSIIAWLIVFPFMLIQANSTKYKNKT